MKLLVIPLLFLAACAPVDTCETPMEYLIQSNCPFESAVIDEQCAVVCPLPYECTDCDCSERGDRTLDCRCIDDKCVSVEEWLK